MDRATVKLFQWSEEFNFPQIHARDLHLNELLLSPYIHRQEYVKIIDHLGRVSTSESTYQTLIDKEVVIKIEAIEKLSSHTHKVCQALAREFHHPGAVTAHLFVSPRHSASFNLHTDPDDVIIYTAEGSKTIQVQEDLITIPTGYGLFIPKDCPHRAINKEASMTISFGLEGFIMDKLHHA